MKIRRTIALLSILLCTFLSFAPGILNLTQVPVVPGQVPQVSGMLSKIVSVVPVSAAEAASVSTVNRPQVMEISYKLFGIFPLKTNKVEVMPSLMLIPGGQSIGVSLQTQGVIIVGQAPVMGQDGKKRYPAKEAGVEIGDVILKIDGKEVHSDQEVAEAIHQAGASQGKVGLLLKHKGEIIEKSVATVYCPETSRHRIGLYVRDEAAGVGTLTFIDPVTRKYGALGHIINDADTNQRIEVADGKIVNSSIYGIEKGSRGHPGEKVGSFDTNSMFSGSIEKNTMTGIFGVLNGQISNPYFERAIPVGWESEVKEGPAKIYTVIQGDRIQEYDVNIERILSHRTDAKNMVIRVTDPELIKATGGIIQGMSGSPIVQDGKLIGAVTHVFVNDSLRGYGVFMQNMLRESGILERSEAA
ncbi:SpoIVB peptidase [Paradesulfitobacterium ferrireducens]|uniref:SpoIVB peptidase n=1 Tax=Paradesulfitobacterium ferrireducens TaxID=2816476 RepID=UPI001A902AFE|nr:SpoIVB peptidase [Paradesulfitobacterium ferrireducens]